MKGDEQTMATVVRGDSMMKEMQQKQRKVRLQLAFLRGRMRLHLVLEGLLAVAASLVSLAAFSLALDWLVRPELATRLALLAVFSLAIVAVLYWRLIRSLRIPLDDLLIAELLDRRRPGIGQRIANVLQLPQLCASDLDASPAMIYEAVMEDAHALDQINLTGMLNVERRRNLLLVLIGLALLVGGFCWWFHGPASLWSRRWFRGSDVRWPQKTYLSVVGLGDGDRLLIPHGETNLLQISTAPQLIRADGGWWLGGRGKPFFLEGSDPPSSQMPESVAIEYRTADGTRRRGNFTRFESGLFRYELPPLTEEASFSVHGGDDWLGPIRLMPIRRPTVSSLSVVAQLPGSTEPTIYRAGALDVQLEFLPTTKIELRMESDQPLTHASLHGQGANIPKLERIDNQHYVARFEMQEQSTFEFQLVSELGKLVSKPYFLTLGLLNDRAPRLTIRSTGVGRRVTPSAKIPLTVRGMDDFGIAEMAVDLEQTALVELKPKVDMHQPFSEKWTAAEVKLPTDVERDPQISLADFSIAAGNSLRLRATGIDQSVLGAHRGESRWLSFQVVTPEELFYEILMRQREQRNRFAKAVEMSRGQIATLNALATPEDRNALSRVHQVVAQQVWRIVGQLDASLLEMTLNDLGTSQTRDLLKTSIIEPMRELHSNDFGQLQAKLQKVLEKESPPQEDREAAVAAQEEVVKKMQRILDQMSQWESFVDVVNQLRQIMKTQNQVKETTEKLQKERVRDIFDE